MLVSYTTAGAGHRRAAEAMAQALARLIPDADIVCHDALKCTPLWWRWSYPRTYYYLVRATAWLWALAFRCLDHPIGYAIWQPIRRQGNLIMAWRWLRELQQHPPQLIVVTHFFPCDVISTAKRAGWLRAPLVVVVTDFHPHAFWLSREAEAYICSTEQGARTLVARGIPADRIHVLGIPIDRRFAEIRDREAIRRQVGLSGGRRTILITSGGATVGPFEAVVRALTALERCWPGRIQLLVVCGENTKTAARLRAAARQTSMPVKVFEFVETMPELMAASDLIVAKAGGLTVTEAMAAGLPMLMYHVIPGQEQANARALINAGAAVLIRDPKRVAETVRRLCEDPGRMAALRQAAQRLSHPHAADDIVEQVIKPLLQSPMTKFQ